MANESTPGIRRSLLRPADSSRSDRVTFVELFFDLIFVFALTQLSGYLYENQTPLGALEGVVMVLALWWVWVQTTWVTNWLDPARLPVRGVMIACALVALVLSTSIAESFGDRALVFATAYVVLQLGRTLFIVLATKNHDAQTAMNFTRILLWLALGSVFWMTGALLPLAWQLPMWAIALAIEYLAGVVNFAVPGLGRSRLEHWDLSGEHIAERAALFVLIALGESFLVTGFAFVDLEATVPRTLGMLSAFFSTVAMWWIYFDSGERIGSTIIAKSSSPAKLARTAYTYVHAVIIAGIVLTSVADKELLSHPEKHPDLAVIIVMIGGPALFLIGSALFRFALTRAVLVPHLAGIGALVALGIAGPTLTPVVIGWAGTGILIGVAAWETTRRVRAGKQGGG